MDFVEICNVCTRKVIIKAAKRIFNSDKIRRSYYYFYFGVTFFEHTVFIIIMARAYRCRRCGVKAKLCLLLVCHDH